MVRFGVVLCVFILSSIRVDAASTRAFRRIDGASVKKTETNLWPYAVMIDNHSSARPQAGLGNASIVYEALAEGGIPRFMAIYADNNVKQIGPVRSARPYFVKIAAEYRAAYLHAGGSPDSLILLNSLRMPNIEGIKGKTANFFYRYGGTGVHNLFTNAQRVVAAIKQAGFAKYKPTYRPWKFTSEPGLSKRRTGLHGATVDLGAGRSYQIKYTYDRKRNAYLRSTGGVALVDRITRAPVYAKNVVLMLVPKEKVLDRKGRLDINVLGKGKALLLKNGNAMTIQWSKPTIYGRTVFTTKDKKEIEFNRGSVWITIVPAGHRYTLF